MVPSALTSPWAGEMPRDNSENDEEMLINMDYKWVQIHAQDGYEKVSIAINQDVYE